MADRDALPDRIAHNDTQDDAVQEDCAGCGDPIPAGTPPYPADMTGAGRLCKPCARMTTAGLDDLVPCGDCPGGPLFGPDEIAEHRSAAHQGDAGPLEPCQPIGCDNGYHLPGCPFASADCEDPWHSAPGETAPPDPCPACDAAAEPDGQTPHELRQVAEWHAVGCEAVERWTNDTNGDN
jgi:hypothetical protein